MKQKIQNFFKEIGIISFSLTLSLVAFMGYSIAKGWVEPTTAPPGGNLGAPINTSGFAQLKNGALGVNGLFRAFSTAIFDGNVGIGTTSPSQKLEVAGTIRTTGLQIPAGAGAGRVLTSDAAGNASWGTGGARRNCECLWTRNFVGTLTCSGNKVVVGVCGNGEEGRHNGTYCCDIF